MKGINLVGALCFYSTAVTLPHRILYSRNIKTPVIIRISSRFALKVCFLVFIISNIVYRLGNDKMMQTIEWDVCGYYSYLPGFFYDDPAHLNNVDHINATYLNGGGYQAWKAPNGNYIYKYSCGQALMFLPAFACAHAAAKIFSYPVNGFSLRTRPQSILKVCLWHAWACGCSKKF